MKTFMCACCLVLASTAITVTAAAQQQKGDKEVGIGGSFLVSKPKGGSTFANGNVVGTLGYYYTRQIKFNVGTSLNISRTPGSPGFGGVGGTSASTTVSGQILYGASYNFITGSATTFPYLGIGASTSVSNAQGSQSSTSVDPYVGVQHFFSRTASFFVQADVMPQSDVTTILNTFGFRIVF
jgi:hypothetical protein